MRYTSWEVAAAIIARISGKEINLTHEELEAVRGTVPVAEYHPGKVVYRIGTPEAWPEEPNGDMLNGHKDLDGNPIPKVVKCRHCGYEMGRHKAGTLSCPFGRGKFPHYFTAQFYEPRQIKALDEGFEVDGA